MNASAETSKFNDTSQSDEKNSERAAEGVNAKIASGVEDKINGNTWEGTVSGADDTSQSSEKDSEKTAAGVDDKIASVIEDKIDGEDVGRNSIWRR